MKDVTISIPGDVLEHAKIPRGHIERELRKELALQLYREGIVSHAGACRIANLQKLEFQFLLGERGICQQYDVADLHDDMTNLSGLTAPKKRTRSRGKRQIGIKP